MTNKREREERLQTRFKFARAFVSGELSFKSAADEVARGLGISVKTLRRDVARARQHQRYDEWRPDKPGPKLGQHRTPIVAGRLIEEATYANADQKLNRAKQARDARHDLVNAGLDHAELQSHSTIKRRMAEIEARDRSFFAIQRHGRDGKWGLEVQKGALEVERPLQVVQMDHQRCDHPLGSHHSSLILLVVFRPRWLPGSAAIPVPGLGAVSAVNGGRASSSLLATS